MFFKPKQEVMMKKPIKLIGVAVAVLMFSVIAKADQLVFTTTLTGPQEVPPTASPGIGVH